MGTVAGPVGGVNLQARMAPDRLRALSRSNPAGQGPQAGEYPALGDPGDVQARKGGLAGLQYVRRWLSNLFTAQHDPGQTFYNPAGLATESGGKVKDPPIALRFEMDTYYRTFGQWAQSFPNGGWTRVPTGNRYAPWSLQLKPADNQPQWRPWAQTDQVAIYTGGKQPQQTSPSWPLLTSAATTSSFGSHTPQLPAQPGGVYSEGIYG